MTIIVSVVLPDEQAVTTFLGAPFASHLDAYGTITERVHLVVHTVRPEVHYKAILAPIADKFPDDTVRVTVLGLPTPDSDLACEREARKLGGPVDCFYCVEPADILDGNKLRQIIGDFDA